MVKDACCCSRPRLLWKLKSGTLCGFGNKSWNLDYFFELTYLDLTSLTDFFGRSWTCWTTSDMAISIWYISFLQHLLGLAPATLNIQGSSPLRSRSSPLGLSSLSPDETKKINEANRALEVAVWVAEQSLQCPSKFIGLNIIFPEDLGGHCIHGPSSMWVLREFRFLEGTRDARRAAAYMCQFTPIGIQASDWNSLQLYFFPSSFVFGLAKLGLSSEQS